MRFLRNVILMGLVNLGIILTISVLLQVTGLSAYLAQSGLQYGGLFILCLVFGMGGAFFSLFMSKHIVKWTMGVRIVPWGQGSPEIHRVHQMLQKVSSNAKLKKLPEFGIYQSPEMNAFATGPSESNALVAVSTGLIENMTDGELEGVLAHEVAHIKNGDMVTMTLLQGIVNALVMFLARMIAMVVTSNSRDARDSYMLRYGIILVCEMVLGFFGILITSWFSRRREYRADRGGAMYSSPQKMLSSLEALQRRFEPIDQRAPQLAAFKISTGHPRGFLALFSTHPPLKDRITALRAASLVR